MIAAIFRRRGAVGGVYPGANEPALPAVDGARRAAGVVFAQLVDPGDEAVALLGGHRPPR